MLELIWIGCYLDILFSSAQLEGHVKPQRKQQQQRVALQIRTLRQLEERHVPPQAVSIAAHAPAERSLHVYIEVKRGTKRPDQMVMYLDPFAFVGRTKAKQGKAVVRACRSDKQTVSTLGDVEGRV